MFLATAANPHENGRAVRIVRYRQDEGRVFAIDADRLHREPGLLNGFHRWNEVRIRVQDFVAYLVLLASVIASLAVAWWLFVPGVALCGLLIALNRKLAGDLARRAARKSSDAFLYLHSAGVLWLVRS